MRSRNIVPDLVSADYLLAPNHDPTSHQRMVLLEALSLGADNRLARTDIYRAIGAA